MARSLRYVILAVIAAALLVIAALVVWRKLPTSPVEERVERTIVTTLQREAAESFLVTGRLEMTASVRATNTRVLFPDILDLKLGSASARVRVPGTVSYGFDVSGLNAGDVEIGEDGEVVVALPPLQIYAVDPDLTRIEIETRSGWLRLNAAEREVTREAVRHLRTALAAQAEAHLQDSVQPRMNTARALEVILKPVLESAGVPDPRVRVHLGGGVLFEGSD